MVGSWADGLITVNQTPSRLRRVIEAFREAGGEDKPVHVQVHLSWADDDATRSPSPTTSGAPTCSASSSRGNLELPDAVRRRRPLRAARRRGGAGPRVADPGQHVEWLQQIADLGVDSSSCTTSASEQQRFIEAFGEQVLPEVAS